MPAAAPTSTSCGVWTPRKGRLKPTSRTMSPVTTRSAVGISLRTVNPPNVVAAFMVCPLGKE